MQRHLQKTLWCLVGLEGEGRSAAPSLPEVREFRELSQTMDRAVGSGKSDEKNKDEACTGFSFPH